MWHSKVQTGHLRKRMACPTSGCESKHLQATYKEEIRWYWVGDTHNRVFEVFIKRNATIDGLKKAIQGQKPSFKDIPADSLDLHKVGE